MKGGGETFMRILVSIGFSNHDGILRRLNYVGNYNRLYSNGNHLLFCFSL